MPEQKSQAIVQRRLLVIESIQRLSGRAERWVTVSEIVTDLKEQGYAVEVHSIRRDLKSLLETHQQLECNDNSNNDGIAKNGLAHGYRWVGKDKPTNGGITLPEALSLVMVERYLSQSLPALLNRPLKDIFYKAHQILELHKKSQITHWPDKISVIQPAQPLIPPKAEFDVLIAVHEALLNEMQLHVKYQSTQLAERPIKEFRLHPLGLIQRGTITYLAAMANEYEDVYLYAVHRILSAKISANKIRQKIGFNIVEFAESQGHFGNKGMIAFEAKICEQLALILEESRLSQNQVISPSNEAGYRFLKADIQETWQLKWWILGEGDRIEVLKPLELRLEIINTLKKCNNNYLKNYLG